MSAGQPTPIEPGATLGVFGGGQLGRMFAAAATRMGYRVLVFAPEPNCPAGQIAHEHVQAAYDDEEAVDAFARRCDAITLEWENVPVAAVEIAARHAPVRPGAAPLAIAQDRLAERAFLDDHGFPAAPHALVHSAGETAEAIARIGAPAVLKTARGGYDGRGQARIDHPDDAPAAWAALAAEAALLEAWVRYRRELSVIVARSPAGELRTVGPVENTHVNHILDLSVVPAGVEDDVAARAVELAHAVADALALEGVICVEMFETQDGALLVNELAPRPHNSGHLTIEACATSQFEQQVRALCALPLGDTTVVRPAAMVNLLGDLWTAGPPAWHAALGLPGVSLHLYGKAQARPGRKMGHLTAIARSPAEALERALAAREAVVPPDTLARMLETDRVTIR